MGDDKVWKDLEKHLYNSKVDEYRKAIKTGGTGETEGPSTPSNLPVAPEIDGIFF